MARILAIQAEAIHQRVPLVIGSAQDVALYD
jgi:fructose-1,6-bisphosphatase